MTAASSGWERQVPRAASTRSLREAAIADFERAWRAGPPPSIDDYLPGSDCNAQRSLLLELVHADLECRLKGGESVRVEAYLHRYPHLAGDRAVVLNLLQAEHQLRRRREAGIDLEEYERRFPEHFQELRRRLAGASTLARGEGTALGRPPVVPGFEIVQEIGRGGMGVIYQARQIRLGRLVALKFLPEELIRDHELQSRFVHEAVTASGLNHPNICTVHELGELDGRPFIVMEFIEGQTLHALVQEPPDIARATRLIRQAARALAAAHAASVVHRDIKPANLMVRDDGLVKVLDFGLARRLPPPSAPDNFDALGPGQLLGTIAYMSPEQARCEALATSSDVFSLGVVLYQLLTGQHPFERESDVATLHAIAAAEPIVPTRWNPEIPAALQGLVLSMLHKEPPLRPSAAAVHKRCR
jgi:hypothetical protein